MGRKVDEVARYTKQHKQDEPYQKMGNFAIRHHESAILVKAQLPII